MRKLTEEEKEKKLAAKKARLAGIRAAKKARQEIKRAEKKAEKEKLLAEQKIKQELLRAEKKAEKEKLLAEQKLEKARIREEKKEATRQRILKKKRDAYKPIHQKNLRKRQNKRAYAKLKAARLAEKAKMGDVRGYYRIILTKNYEMIEELTHCWWLLNAHERFENYIKENRAGIIGEQRITQSHIDEKPVLYEILILKKIDPDKDDGVRQFRNELGTFVENTISNNDTYAIIAKETWYVPETYNVYGYHPIYERKTGLWIYNNIINHDCTRDNIKNVFMCENKLIVQYTSDLDFITCKTKEECRHLYNCLEDACKGNKFVLFNNEIVDAMKPWLYNQLEEKTGWDRKKLYKSKG